MTPTEQDRRSSGPRRQPARFSPFWLMGGVLLLMVVATGIVNVVSDAGEIEYSQFKNYINEGKVSNVVITADRIRGEYYKDSAPVPFSTVPMSRR
jgi:hypothetical protein